MLLPQNKTLKSLFFVVFYLEIVSNASQRQQLELVGKISQIGLERHRNAAISAGVFAATDSGHFAAATSGLRFGTRQETIGTVAANEFGSTDTPFEQSRRRQSQFFQDFGTTSVTTATVNESTANGMGKQAHSGL